MTATHKPSAGELLRFRHSVINYIESRGAQPDEWYGYRIETAAGVLRISAEDGWIACHFEDLELGREFSESVGRPCNQHTGNWNFLFSDSLDPGFVIHNFGFFFESLVDWKPVVAAVL